MPLWLLHGLGTIIGTVLALLPVRARRTTEKNLRACFPELNAAQLRALTCSSLINTVNTALEMGKAWLQPVARTVALVRLSDGYEAYRSAVASGQGVILLVPHLSNWEVLGFFACEGAKATFMYQPPRQAAMDRLLREVRSRSGVDLAPTTRKGVVQVLAALKRGEMVGILPDQVPADESGVFAPFFAETAFTMTLVSKLLQRNKARVFCAFAERLPAGRGFRAVFREADPDIYDPDLQRSVNALNRSVENLVNMAPSQYQWEYKRFRRRPDNSEFY